MTLADLSKAAILACLLPGHILLGADETVPPLRRLTIGIHVEYFPTDLLNTRYVIQIPPNANPPTQYNYYASSDSSKWAPGAVVEYRLTEHVSLAGELHFHHANYQVTTDILTGINTSTTNVDNRPLTTIVETTQANFWEYPFLVHYYGLLKHGRLRRTYLTGGLEWRHVGKIRTGNDFTYSDASTYYNEVPAIPHNVNVAGAVVGVGFRLVDDFHIRVTPEMRLIRWLGNSLQGPAYQTVANQLEAGIGISF